jgi:hypothetical protein
MGKTPFGLRSMHRGNRSMSCRLCNLAEDPGICPRTMQLLGSDFPTPTGPQHSLVARPRATGYCSSSLLYSFFNFWFVLSLCYTMSTQVMQGLPMIIHRFPLVERYLCLYGHFSILALTLSLVSELSVPHSLVHLHSFLWMPPTSSIEPLNKCSSFIVDIWSEAVTASFSSAPLLFGYITIEGRSEVFAPVGYPNTYSNAGKNT